MKLRPEIAALDRLPAGTYLPFADCQPVIPDMYQDVLALLKIGTNAVAIVTPHDAGVARAIYDVTARLEKQGLTVSILHATRNVVIAFHEAHRARAKVLGESGEATVDERAGFELIEHALSLGASDIHIETRGPTAHVMFRVNGERVKQPDLATRKAHSICSLLYNVHADANNKETNWDSGVVKDTVIDYMTNKAQHCQVRFHSAPIHPAGNFQCVMRLLLMEGQASKALEDVGYTAAQVREIESMLLGSTGLVLLVGAVNAGKSTSLQSLIRRIMDRRGEHIKLVTVEDPVEYVIPGASQMGVPKGRKGLTDAQSESIYNTYLKATLRQDTNVVMVGEIRSEESAKTVKDLVLTGRKTLTTLHVYEAFATFARLRELGVPPSLLHTHGFIAGVVFQKLLPRLCTHCALTLERARSLRMIHHDLDARLRNLVEENHIEGAGIRVRNPQGCAKCNHTGIIGRTLCAEVLVPDETFLAYMRADQEPEAREYWLANAPLDDGRKIGTALAHAVARMGMGQVDPNDVEVEFGGLHTLIARLRAMSRPPAGARGGMFGRAGNSPGAAQGRSVRSGSRRGVGEIVEPQPDHPPAEVGALVHTGPAAPQPAGASVPESMRAPESSSGTGTGTGAGADAGNGEDHVLT